MPIRRIDENVERHLRHRKKGISINGYWPEWKNFNGFHPVKQNRSFTVPWTTYFIMSWFREFMIWRETPCLWFNKSSTKSLPDKFPLFYQIVFRKTPTKTLIFSQRFSRNVWMIPRAICRYTRFLRFYQTAWRFALLLRYRAKKYPKSCMPCIFNEDRYMAWCRFKSGWCRKAVALPLRYRHATGFQCFLRKMARLPVHQSNDQAG